MLKAKGIFPVIRKPEVDETLSKPLTVEQTVMYIALKKALKVERDMLGEGYLPGDFLVAADTVVYKDEIIGKPADEKDAFRIFQQLRNTFHHVVTGVALVEVGTSNRRGFYEKTEVWFKDYTREETADYLKTGEAWDKAGGYAIQGGWAKHILRIKGDYDNVVGLPWTKTVEELQKMGFQIMEAGGAE